MTTCQSGSPTPIVCRRNAARPDSAQPTTTWYLKRPVRATIRPPMKLITTSPTDCGMKTSPDSVRRGSQRRLDETSAGRSPRRNSTALERMAITPVSTYIRFAEQRHRDDRVRVPGVPAARRAEAAPPPPPAAPTVNVDPQPYAWYAHAEARSPATVATVSKAAPVKSMSEIRPPWRVFGRVVQMVASATAPMGRLMKKHQRQPGPSAKNPPTGGPSSAPAVIIARMYPTYLARSMGVYMSAITTSTQARMKPPPMPCTPRAMMSVIIVGASPGPQRSDEEDDDPGDDERSPSEHVGELPHDRHHHCRSQQVEREHPRDELEPAEVREDGRQRRRHDGAVERAEETCTSPARGAAASSRVRSAGRPSTGSDDEMDAANSHLVRAAAGPRASYRSGACRP